MTKSCPNRTAEGWGGGRCEHKRPERLPLSEIRPVPRRGLSRVEAAMYIGISPTKFDELRTSGRISPPRLIDGRKVWDVRDLDNWIDSLKAGPSLDTSSIVDRLA